MTTDIFVMYTENLIKFDISELYTFLLFYYSQSTVKNCLITIGEVFYNCLAPLFCKDMEVPILVKKMGPRRFT